MNKAGDAYRRGANGEAWPPETWLAAVMEEAGWLRPRPGWSRWARWWHRQRSYRTLAGLHRAWEAEREGILWRERVKSVIRAEEASPERVEREVLRAREQRDERHRELDALAKRLRATFGARRR